MISFANGVVTDLISQHAPYIADRDRGPSTLDNPATITAVGPYVLEGSKPGAAAASCWLAHTVIPLNRGGHGKLVRTCALNCRRLWMYLRDHHLHYFRFERELKRVDDARDPFTFVPLHVPDTNVLCFIVRPMAIQKGSLVAVDSQLKRLNEINEALYTRLSVPSAERGDRMPYSQQYYVSRTTFSSQTYSLSSVAHMLEQLGVSAADYEKHGIFVLRSTVMNPLHFEARRQGTDYLMGFVRYMHDQAWHLLNDGPTPGG
jgi:phage gp46-like protein